MKTAFILPRPTVTFVTLTELLVNAELPASNKAVPTICPQDLSYESSVYFEITPVVNVLILTVTAEVEPSL